MMDDQVLSFPIEVEDSAKTKSLKTGVDDVSEVNFEDVVSDSMGLDNFSDEDMMFGRGEEYENQSSPIAEEVSGTNHDVYETPEGTRLWIPRVDDALRIGLGYEFPSVEAADDAYMRYADAAGFTVRRANAKKNRHNVVTNRYLFCSREGMPSKKDFGSIGMVSGDHKHRNSNVKRIGCKARCKFKLIKGTTRYVIYKFEEMHNHPLLNPRDMDLSRLRRQLQYTDFRKVYNASSASIGASNTHRIEAAMKGGYEYMDSTSVDYQNARTAMRNFVGKKDAQMLVNLLSNRKRKVPEFYFEYLSVDRELKAIFWADEIARMNFKEFGDTLSFDATYRMNDHSMIFIPFISIDNHKKSVVVGSALVRKEDIESYKWVLKAFIKAHGKEPQFVITDQCPAMKQAIPAVFTEAKHRLCMWHIMKKLPNKITANLDANRTFKKRFNKLVWNTHISQDVFDQEWHAIIDEYDLHANDWLNYMFSIRQSWIPAYFIDDPMSGLMKTTSRSESSHSFFRIYAHYCNDLVKFLHAFDCAIEKQRNKHRCLEFVTRNSLPRCATPLLIERHASELFTRTIFFEVQKEIRKAILFCGIAHIDNVENLKFYRVSHMNKKCILKASYTVVRDVANTSITCDCSFFVRHGILCRHMLKTLLNDGVDYIPDVLVSRRWTRALVPVEIQAARARYGEIDVEKERLINEGYTIMDLLISRLRNDKSKLKLLIETLDKMKVQFDVNTLVGTSTIDRLEAMKEYYGVEVPDSVDIFPPTGIRNKGCGRKKRLVGARERAAKKNKTPKRMCKACFTMAHHDSRNCPSR